MSADFLDTVVSFLDPAVSITLLDVAEEDPDQDGIDPVEEAKQIVERGAERARALGRHVEWRVARGEAGPEIVRAAVEGKFDAIFMSLRGVYRRGDTSAFASNTRYVLEHAALPRDPGLRTQVDPPAAPSGQGVDMNSLSRSIAS